MTYTLSGNPVLDRRDTFTALWSLFTSSRWAALLLGLLGLTAVAWGVWPQFLSWTGSSTAAPAATTHIGDYVALWLRLLLGLFGFSLLLRLADRLEVAVHLPRHLARARVLYTSEPVCAGELSAPPERLTDTVLREELKSIPAGWSYRVWHTTEGDCDVVYVERLRFALWGDVGLHLGCLIVIAGLFVGSQWGWHESGIALAAGETYAIEHAPGSTVALDSSRVENGRQETQVTVSLPGGRTQQSLIAPAQPLLMLPLALFQTGAGPALRVTVTNSKGQPLPLQPLVQNSRPAQSAALKFVGDQDDGSIAVSALGQTLRISRYSSLPGEGYWVPVFLVQVFQGNQSTPQLSRYLWKDDTFVWRDNTYTLSLEDYLTLNAASDPGWVVVAAGLAFLVCGSLLRQRPGPILIRIATVKDAEARTVEVASRSAGVIAAQDFLRRLRGDS